MDYKKLITDSIKGDYDKDELLSLVAVPKDTAMADLCRTAIA